MQFYKICEGIGTCCYQLSQLRHIKITTTLIAAGKSIYNLFSNAINYLITGASNSSKGIVDKITNNSRIQTLRIKANLFFSCQIFKLTPFLPAEYIAPQLIRYLFLVDIALIVGACYNIRADYHEMKEAKETVSKVMFGTNLIGSVMMLAASVLHLLQLAISSAPVLLVIKSVVFYLGLAATPFFLLGLGLYLWIQREVIAEKFKTLRTYCQNEKSCTGSPKI